MQARNPEQRLTMLEEQMQALKDLPGRVTVLESQILQLRTEMTDGFSALRDDLRAELHGAAKGLETGLRTELHATRDTLRSEIHAVRDELRGALHGLSADVKKGVEETQSLVKLLHEHTLLEIGKLRRPDVP